MNISYTSYGGSLSASIMKSSHGFNGERLDFIVGGYHLGNGYRTYNPWLMRFLSPDRLSPFGVGGVNAYAYCEGDPVNYRDPAGLMKKTVSRPLGGVVKLHGLKQAAYSEEYYKLYDKINENRLSAALFLADAYKEESPIADLVFEHLQGWTGDDIKGANISAVFAGSVMKSISADVALEYVGGMQVSGVKVGNYLLDSRMTLEDRFNLSNYEWRMGVINNKRFSRSSQVVAFKQNQQYANNLRRLSQQFRYNQVMSPAYG